MKIPLKLCWFLYVVSYISQYELFLENNARSWRHSILNGFKYNKNLKYFFHSPLHVLVSNVKWGFDPIYSFSLYGMVYSPSLHTKKSPFIYFNIHQIMCYLYVLNYSVLGITK